MAEVPIAFALAVVAMGLSIFLLIQQATLNRMNIPESTLEEKETPPQPKVQVLPEEESDWESPHLEQILSAVLSGPTGVVHGIVGDTGELEITHLPAKKQQLEG